MLADIKKRSEEYRSNKTTTPAPVAAAVPTNTKVGSFNF